MSEFLPDQPLPDDGIPPLAHVRRRRARRRHEIHKKRKTHLAIRPKSDLSRPVRFAPFVHIPEPDDAWKEKIRICTQCAKPFAPTSLWQRTCKPDCVAVKTYPPQNTRKRVLMLNKVAQLPENNIGWNCSTCSFRNDNFQFFDLDHIKAVGHGGENIIANLQILCPNCHRLKTITDRLLGKPTTRLSQFPSPSADTGGSSGSRLVMLQPPTEA